MPGRKYRVTDYIPQVRNVAYDVINTSTTETGNFGDYTVRDSSTGGFDIIMTAASKTSFEPEAQAIARDDDTYFSSCDLSRWRLWVDIDGDDSSDPSTSTKYMNAMPDVL